MKRFVWTVCISMLAATAAMAQSATPVANTNKPPAAPATPPVPGSKVAVIDFRSALMDSDPGKVAQQQYEKDIAGEKGKVEKLQKEFEDLQTKLAAAKTDAEKSTINRDIQNVTRDAQRAQDDAQRISTELQEKLLPPVAALVNKHVEEYAKENGLALVLDPRTDPSNVIYASLAMDVTSEVMRRVNAEFAKNPKVIAPAPGGAAAPK